MRNRVTTRMENGTQNTGTEMECLARRERGKYVLGIQMHVAGNVFVEQRAREREKETEKESCEMH